MNKAITDGLVFMPTAFSQGLGVWSSGDGTPGSDTYAGAGGGVFVPADQDFGGCLELVKTAGVQRVRYMAETTILPGCYLRVTARVKAVSGALPAVRIAGYAGTANGALGGVVTAAQAVQLSAYGEVVEVSAIIGTGNRTGVDLVWHGALYGHLGLDFTGASGGVLRVDDIAIEDVSSVFLSDVVGMVDVRDFGAIGDGVTNDSAAFEAADAAAQGREVLVSEGTYYLGSNVTFQSQVRFEGTVTMPVAARLILQRNFEYQTYLDAFGDEEEAFRKAYQALLNFSDHDSLDLGGRRIALREPLDMQAVDPQRTSFAVRRVIRNGQFEPVAGPAWAPDVVSSQATYAAGQPLRLANVINAANVQRGSLVTGSGVGREVYVREVDVANRIVTLSQPLFDAAGTQSFTFTRFKYLLDFSGYDNLAQFVISDVEFRCSGIASGVMLARQGLTFHLRDCFITKPADRGVTSIGSGCQGMLLDRCQWISNEQAAPAGQRQTIAFNVNANDLKLRDNRAVMFRHFGVIAGSGSIISGNHWFQGDQSVGGTRMPGLIFTYPNIKTTVSGNYIDNNWIEWTNEHDASPDLGQQFSFGGLTIDGNIFTANDVASWFRWLIIKPYGAGHFIHGLSVSGNVFRTLNGTIDRVDDVNTSIADLDRNRMRNITFSGNVFHGVATETRNPLPVKFTQTTADDAWVIGTGGQLPFEGWARTVESVTPIGRIAASPTRSNFDQPWAETRYGVNNDHIRVVFGEPVTGTVQSMIRMDNPL